MSTLIRWNPVRRNPLDRFVDEAWRNFPAVYENGTRTLPLDVQEDDNAYFVYAELPGQNPDDINVRFHDGVLTIEAETQYEHNENNGNGGENGKRVLLRERRYGKFSRSVRLPEAVSADAIDASYENGVLTLTLPKAEEAKPKQITVRS